MTTIRRRKQLAYLLLLAPLTTTQAQDTLAMYDDELLLTIATGTEQPVAKAPSVATVITAQQIHDMGATTLSQVLEVVPGLHVFPQVRTGMEAGYSIRGIHTALTSEVLMLRNGVPIQQPSSGHRFNAFELPVNNIKRIEVIRGPGSAVHGADAFAGVINIITKDASDMEGSQAGARAGSFKSRDAWVQHGGTYGGWDIAFDLAVMKTDGDRNRILERDAQTGIDEALAASNIPPASQAPGPIPTQRDWLNSALKLHKDHWTIDFWHWQARNSGTGGNATLVLDKDSVGSEDYSSNQIDIRYQRELSLNWQFDGHLAYGEQQLRRRFMLFPQGATLPINSSGNVAFGDPSANLVNFPDGLHGNPNGDIYRSDLELNTVYDGLINHRLRLGVGGSSQEAYVFTTTNFGPGVIDGTEGSVDGTLTFIDSGPDLFYDENRKQRYRYHALVQDEWSFLRDWTLTAGLRYDHYSDFGSTTNPRLALVWATRQNLTTKLLYGRAFRAPSFNELYLQSNPSTWGNPNLGPVTIDTTELVFNYDPRLDLHTQANIYYYEIDDAIAYVPDTVKNVVAATNLGGQRGHGLELEANWQVSNALKLQSNFAWQDSQYTLTDNDVSEAPGRQFFIAGLWHFQPEWSLYSQAKWIGNRQRASTDHRHDIADYYLVNLSLRHSPFGQNWEAALLVKNLFDRQADDPSNGAIPVDFPKEGRSVMGEFSLKF